jgi:hypothetical protein
MSRTVRINVISSINAAQVHSESPKKKRMVQMKQANKMICQQGKDIENQGGTPGAIVVGQVDYRRLVMLLE